MVAILCKLYSSKVVLCKLYSSKLPFFRLLTSDVGSRRKEVGCLAAHIASVGMGAAAALFSLSLFFLLSVCKDTKRFLRHEKKIIDVPRKR